MRSTVTACILTVAAAIGLGSWHGAVVSAQQSCVTGFDPPTLAVPASGSPATFTVLTATPTCAWGFDGFFLPTWEGPPSIGSGSGPTTVSFPYFVPNHNGPERSVVKSVGGRPLTITQAANPCPLTASPPSPATVSANGGTVTFTVNTTGSPCSYAVSPESGVSVVSGASGSTFPATVTFVVAPNLSRFATFRSVWVSSLGTFVTAPNVGVTQKAPPISTDVLSYAVSFAIHRRGTGGLFTTAPEPIRITNSEAPTASWTATATEPWIVVTPASGVTPATAAISIDPAAAAGLSPNRYTGQVMLTSSVAPLSPTIVDVALTVTDTSSTTSPPIGSLDIPVSSTTPLSGAIPMGGWANDDVGIAKVQLYRSPVPAETLAEVYLGDATRVRGARPDVAWQGSFPEAARAGWGFMLLSNVLPGGSGGVFELSAYAEDIEGHRTLLGRKTVTFDNMTSPLPFGTIDVPIQGGTASGTLTNQGWVLAQPGRNLPIDGSTIGVIVDGAFLPSVATYGLPRPDVASYFAFPTYANGNGPGAQFSIDTTQIADGLHTIVWYATDNLGVPQGIGSRFFTVENGSASQVGGVTDTRSAAAIRSMPQTQAFVWNRRGFDERSWSLLWSGGRTHEILQAPGERLELALDTWWWSKGCGLYAGYLMSGDVAGPLPPGSSLDGERGVFSWLPPVQFAGTFDLVFVRRACGGREQKIPVRVVIGPH